MLTLEIIFQTLCDMHKRNPRSPNQVEFELHWQGNCIKIKNNVNNKSFQPKSQSFVVEYPLYREVFTSDKSTGVLQRFICSILTKLIELYICDNVHNNLIGRGSMSCINAVVNDIFEESYGYTKDCYIMRLDLEGCFPNIVQDIAYEQLKKLVVDNYKGDFLDDILYILQVCIFSYPTHHCDRQSPLYEWRNIKPEKSLFRKPDGIGGAIGYELWQKAVLFYFNQIYWFVKKQGIRAEFYVDDIFLISKNKYKLLSVIPTLRKMYVDLGATLHRRKFYLQHVSKGTECLGKHIRYGRIYPNNRIINKAISRIRYFNHHISTENIEKFISVLNSYLSHCRQGNGYNQAKKIIRHIDKRWFRYIHFNEKRLILQVNDDYTKRRIIIRKYRLL